ncbi:hypothetical protein OS493_024437 [Desmophyllum pertusum]|uniref:Uncharacterized protein n=1 Tax=Desmophyllum pertusum TaxID=174260 RepID=A0A9W9YA37_9CNID|nr:hypothetical protein OS493_024437 [Desmophyllum pertusum]
MGTSSSNDPKVKDLISKTKDGLKIDPKFEHDAPLTVAYSTVANTNKLRDTPHGATFARTEEDLEMYDVRAVNLNGVLLSKIAKCGRKDNIAVVLAIKDVRGKVGSSLAGLPEAIVKIVANFVRAAVVGGLPEVYPSEPDKEDRDEIECESSEEDDDDQPAVMSAGAASSSGERGIAASNLSSGTPPTCTGMLI